MSHIINYTYTNEYIEYYITYAIHIIYNTKEYIEYHITYAIHKYKFKNTSIYYILYRSKSGPNGCNYPNIFCLQRSF